MISSSMAANYAEDVAELYRDAELRILERITAALSKDLDAPEAELLQLARLQQVRQEVIILLSRLNPIAASAILGNLTDAYDVGEASALLDMGEKLPREAGVSLAKRAAVTRLAADTAAGINSTMPTILRTIDDVYRGVVARSAASVLTGSTTRAQATQEALDHLLGKGLTSVPTARGKMALGDYVTMAVRTAVARSATQGHLDTSHDFGRDYVIIHPGPRACSYCDKWARVILSTHGAPVGKIREQSLVDDGYLEFHVGATIDEARAGGYDHPNDRCGMTTYMPGVTKADEIKRPAWDEKGYAAQQDQRSNERQIRAWKTREVIAITPEAKAYARRHKEDWQAEQRAHLEAHPYLKRQSKREQITGTLSGNPGAARPAK